MQRTQTTSNNSYFSLFSKQQSFRNSQSSNSHFFYHEKSKVPKYHQTFPNVLRQSQTGISSIPPFHSRHEILQFSSERERKIDFAPLSKHQSFHKFTITEFSLSPPRKVKCLQILSNIFKQEFSESLLFIRATKFYNPVESDERKKEIGFATFLNIFKQQFIL